MLGLRPYRILTITLGGLENLFFSGVFFGWASLVYVIKQHGYFSHLCSSTNITSNISDSIVPYNIIPEEDLPSPDEDAFPTCPEQDAQIHLVFTVATFAYEILMFPLGVILDKFGTLLMRLLSSCLIFTGLLLVACSSRDTAYYLFPATCFIAIGGLELLFINMQISNLFGRRKSTVMTFLSGCLDSSAFVFILVKLAYENLGVSLQTSFFILSAASTQMIYNTLLMPKRGHIPYPLPCGYRRAETSADTGVKKEEGLERAQEMLEMDKMPADNEQDTVAQSSQSITEAVKNRRFPSLRSCLLSLPALFLLIWFSLLQLNMFYFLGTLNPGLERLTNNDLNVVSHYTTTLAIFQAFSICISPLCGILLDRHKTKDSIRRPHDDLLDSRIVFVLTTVLYIALNVTLIINVIEVRYVTFLLHIITRSFMYSLVMTGCALFFPIQYFGSTTGLIESTAALVGLLQRAFFAIQQQYLDDDSFWIYITLMVINIITLILPIYIHIYVKRESALSSHPVECRTDENADT